MGRGIGVIVGIGGIGVIGIIVGIGGYMFIRTHKGV